MLRAARFPLASSQGLVRDELGMTAVGRALSLTPLNPVPGQGKVLSKGLHQSNQSAVTHQPRTGGMAGERDQGFAQTQLPSCPLLLIVPMRYEPVWGTKREMHS